MENTPAVDFLERIGKSKIINYLDSKQIIDKIDEAHKYEHIRHNTYLDVNFELSEEFISFKDSISNKNYDIQIEQNSYIDLLKILKINKAVSKNLSEKLESDSVTDLINLLKNATLLDLKNHASESLKKNKRKIPITLILNKSTNKISNIISYKEKHLPYINNKIFIKFIEQLLKQFEFKITDILISPIGDIGISAAFDGQCIKTTALNLIKSPIYGDPSLETFYRGLFISKSLYKGQNIYSAPIRVRCTNQLPVLDNAFVSFNDLTDESVNHIHYQMKDMQRYNFISPFFLKQFELMWHTPASLNEFERVHDTVIENSLLEEYPLELDKYFRFTSVFKGFEESKALTKYKFVLDDKKSAPVDRTLWQLCNDVTYFACNAPYTHIADGQRKNLLEFTSKFIAGNGKHHRFDLQPKMISPYNFLWN